MQHDKRLKRTVRIGEAIDLNWINEMLLRITGVSLNDQNKIWSSRRRGLIQNKRMLRGFIGQIFTQKAMSSFINEYGYDDGDWLCVTHESPVPPGFRFRLNPEQWDEHFKQLKIEEAQERTRKQLGEKL